MSLRVINPEEIGAPKGFSHGMLAPASGRILFVAGQNDQYTFWFVRFIFHSKKRKTEHRTKHNTTQ